MSFSSSQSLNQWVVMLDALYGGSQNYAKTPYESHAHLTEVTGVFAKHNFMQRDVSRAEQFLPKILAWSKALFRKMHAGRRDLEEIIYPVLACAALRSNPYPVAGRLMAGSVMDSGACIKVGTFRLFTILPEPPAVSKEIMIALAPARCPNSMSDSLSPTTTDMRGLNLNSVAACCIRPRFGFLHAQFASGVCGHT
jgi:hypothetical protein